jgi:hypothetical protein
MPDPGSGSAPPESDGSAELAGVYGVPALTDLDFTGMAEPPGGASYGFHVLAPVLRVA